jgi:hypothetical protein
MGWFDNLLNRHKETTDSDMTKQEARIKRRRDMTGGKVANVERMSGLYSGSDARVQFAAPYSNTPIAVPTAFVGIPTPVTDDEATQDACKRIIDKMKDEFSILERSKLLNGTTWRFAKYSKETDSIVWETIPDDTVASVEIDINTGEVKAVNTSETITVSIGIEDTAQITRTRKFTRDRIDIKYEGDSKGKAGLLDYSMANPFKNLPIPFGHDCLEGQWRGISVFGRVYRLLKATHDIKEAREQILAQFRPKMVQTVGKGKVKEWLANNGLSEETLPDPFKDDFFINQEGDKTEFINLQSGITDQYTQAIKDNRTEIIIGTGIPELFWPPLATGNHASTDEQRNLAIQYIKELRRENERSYEILFNDSLKILGYIEFRNYQPVKIAWNSLSMLSLEARVRILDTFTTAATKIIGSAILGTEELLYFIKEFFPDIPIDDAEELKKGQFDMAKLTAILKTDFLSGLDSNEFTPKKEDEPDENDPDEIE